MMTKEEIDNIKYERCLEVALYYSQFKEVPPHIIAQIVSNENSISFKKELLYKTIRFIQEKRENFDWNTLYNLREANYLKH